MKINDDNEINKLLKIIEEDKNKTELNLSFSRTKIRLNTTLLNNIKIKNLLSKNKNRETLDFSNNNLTEIPDYFKIFKKIHTFYMLDNQFEKFPEVLLKFENLKVLSLAVNKLQQIPCSLSKLKLTHLYLNSNRIETICPEIIGISSLEVLNIVDNPIKEIPLSTIVFGLNSIRKFLKQDNEIKQLKDEIMNLTEENQKLNNYVKKLENYIKFLKPNKISLLRNETLNFKPRQLNDDESSTSEIDKKRREFNLYLQEFVNYLEATEKIKLDEKEQEMFSILYLFSDKHKEFWVERLIEHYNKMKPETIRRAISRFNKKYFEIKSKFEEFVLKEFILT